MTEPELKLCPFCQCSEIRRSQDQGNYRFFIYCANCFAQGPIAVGLYASRVKWNTRA